MIIKLIKSQCFFFRRRWRGAGAGAPTGGTTENWQGRATPIRTTNQLNTTALTVQVKKNSVNSRIFAQPPRLEGFRTRESGNLPGAGTLPGGHASRSPNLYTCCTLANVSLLMISVFSRIGARRWYTAVESLIVFLPIFF